MGSLVFVWGRTCRGNPFIGGPKFSTPGTEGGRLIKFLTAYVVEEIQFSVKSVFKVVDVRFELTTSSSSSPFDDDIIYVKALYLVIRWATYDW